MKNILTLILLLSSLLVNGQMMIVSTSSGRSVQNYGVTSSTFGIVGDVVGGDYTFAGNEHNQAPVITDIVVTGDMGTGEVLTVTVSSINNTGYAFDGSECKIYRSTDQLGTSETLIQTYTSDTNVFTYTQVVGDEGSVLRFMITLKLDGGNNPNSVAMSSQYTDAIPAAPNALDIFDVHDYRIWNVADIDPVVSIPNTADPSRPMTPSGNSPSISSGAMRFDRSNSEYLQVPHPSISEPHTAYYYLRLAQVGVGHNVLHLATPVTLSIGSSRDIFINGVDSGENFPNDIVGYHIIKVYTNGASSTVTVDGGTTGSAFTTSATIGGSDGQFGRNSGGANYFNGYLKYYGLITRATTSPEDTAIIAELTSH